MPDDDEWNTKARKGIPPVQEPQQQTVPSEANKVVEVEVNIKGAQNAGQTLDALSATIGKIIAEVVDAMVRAGDLANTPEEINGQSGFVFREVTDAIVSAVLARLKELGRPVQ